MGEERGDRRQINPQIARHLNSLACPRCHGPLAAEGGTLGCSSCRLAFVDEGGALDFMGEGTGRVGLARRLVESKTVTRIYQAMFRPAFSHRASRSHQAQQDAYAQTWLSPAEGPVLDLACGTGQGTGRLAQRFGSERVIGLDTSAAMIAEARVAADRSGRSDLMFARGSALSLPFADQALGAVHCFGAIHLFPSSEQALREVRRTLRPQGSFTCLTARYAERSILQSAPSAFLRAVPAGPSDAEDLAVLLARMDLDLLDVTTSGSLAMFAAARSTAP